MNLGRAGWRRIQEGLVALGFDPGVPDGLVGDGTRRAVRAYQEGAGKEATGFVDAADVTTMRGAAAAAAEAERRRLAELRRPGRVFRNCDTCPEMVVIPAGTFQMGSRRDDDEAEDDERPRHRVSVEPFALGRYEVTRAEYAAFVSATGHSDGSRCWTDDGRGNREWRPRNGASWRDPEVSAGRWHPVVCVSWEDAQSYVRWLSRKTGESYRLPSEAEWEYAARAGTETRWYWGGFAVGPVRACEWRGCVFETAVPTG